MKNRKTFLFTAILFSLTVLLYGQTVADFEVNGTVLIKYNGTATDVIIPASMGITEIEESAFFHCTNLTSITIPNSVTSIGTRAFERCEKLTSVMFADNSKVNIIGDEAFFECFNLISINIPNSVIIIGKKAFASCSSLSNIDIGNSVTSIGNYAFYNNNFSNITIPKSVKTIGESAFLSCRNLKSIVIPTSVSDIGQGAFVACESLTSIKVAMGNAHFISSNGILYNKNKTALVQYPAGKKGTSFTIPNSVISINGEAFNSCTSLKRVTIPKNVTDIGEYAFADCANLEKLTIGNGVKSIGDGAFSGCRRLASITIPDSVTNIGVKVFNDCYNLDVLIVALGNTAYSLQDGVLYNKNKTFLHTYLPGKTGNSFTIPDSVTIIGKWAFATRYFGLLRNITIPDSVTIIDDYAFEWCISLTNVTIGNGVQNIGDYAFGFTDLTIITIGNSVKSIGEHAFTSCDFTSITIPKSVIEIKSCAFSDCQNLTSVTFEGAIPSRDFSGDAFYELGDLYDKFYATDKTKGMPGTYTREKGGSVWTKQ